jgi:hypothetical protein
VVSARRRRESSVMLGLPMRGLAIGAAVAAAITLNGANAYPVNDPDVLRYPAPKLHPQTTGCVTVHGKSTLSDWPYVSKICIGDAAEALDFACPSVADIFHTDKRWEDSVEDMDRRQRKFGCKDIAGLKVRIIEVYPESDEDGFACGLDYNRNKWCTRVEYFEGKTTVTMPNGETFKR